MIKNRTFKTLIELGNNVVSNPTTENIEEFSIVLKDFSNLSLVKCEHCEHFSNKIDNGTGMCKNCLYHYLRYSTHDFEQTPLNFELKKKK